MKTMSGGQAAVAALENEDTEIVFGLIGSATMEMFDALHDSQSIRFIGVHDERTGTHMADGYARASGKAGVVLAGQNGPGTTNLSPVWPRRKQRFHLLSPSPGRYPPPTSTVMRFRRLTSSRCSRRSPKRPGPCLRLTGCLKLSGRGSVPP